MQEELKLAGYSSHIILTGTGRKKTVLFCDDTASLPEKLWQNRVRISPCFRIVGSGLNEDTATLDGHQVLFFIGPLALERIESSLLPGARMWLSYGAYNLLWLTNSDKKAKEMEFFLMKAHLRYECWTIVEQQIVDSHYGEWEVCKQEPLSSILFEKFAADEVMLPVVREYAALITTAVSRLLYMDERTYRRMIEFHRTVEEYAISLYDGRGHDDFFYYLTSINACLTRYNEQMVAAFSPIEDNSASTNSHSLLGLGMASLGINNIGDSFIRYIADQHIIDKLELLMEQPYEGKTLPHSTIHDKVYDQNHLDSVNLSNPDTAVPLLFYFSSRDGFRRQYHTVSIPLVSVYNNTTRGWSLKTLTHEMSHTEVEVVLDLIFRGMNSEYTPHYQPTTYKEALQQLFFAGMLALSKESITSKPRSIEWMIQFTYDEMNEIITHAFDFYYFYHDNLEEYIHDIWCTWEELPSISQNVEDYIRRSLCIIELYKMDNNEILKQEYKSEDSIDILLKILRKQEGAYSPVFNHQYMDNAITILKSYLIHQNLRQRIKTEIANRKFLLKFARSFLFSPVIREVLVQKRKFEFPYKFENLMLGKCSSYDPIILLERVAKEGAPCHAKACLLYYYLAFNHVF